ncbi:MAG: glucosaminidase domain-containing protein [Sulfurimonadaceae bacterium]|jgi:Bax protein|nr:glucosaminidase domain-containing protein [Sulfurimonadaceae bacterium]
MKRILLSWVLVSLTLSADDKKTDFLADFIREGVIEQEMIRTFENMDVQTKKERFYTLIAPIVLKTYNELFKQYSEVAQDIAEQKNQERVVELKLFYGVQEDEELLAALKPHPPSIALAQAALESGWATSRFYLKANNLYGMWSFDTEEPRIAANERRADKTIWLKRFDTIEDAVKAYYELLATSSAYKDFRQMRLETNNPLELVKKLDNYSELGEDYTKELRKVIRYNKLSSYDVQTDY